MNGREDKKCNDLFYTCSLIAYIARKTHNHPTAVANALGKERIPKYTTWRTSITATISTEYRMISLQSAESQKVLSITSHPVNMLFRLIGISVRYING